MQIDIIDRPPLRLASLRHMGPYDRIGDAFARLGPLAAASGLFDRPDVAMYAIYHDDPEAVEPTRLRADAGLAIDADTPVPAGLTEVTLPAGRYARTIYAGPYPGIGEAWARFTAGVAARGETIGDGVACERYLNDPTTTAPGDLRTELAIALV